MLYNDYGKRPFFESLLKELAFLFKITFAFFKYGKKIPFVLCFPQLPSKKTTLAKICNAQGWIITNNPCFNAVLKFYWHDSSIDETKYPDIDNSFLNHTCNNILKVKVDESFYNVFGYKTAIDPLTHQGIAVEKSEYNAKHNGVIINCPIKQDQTKRDCIYQILLDNKIEDDLYEDIRMPVIGDAFPFVYRKLKSGAKRFEAAPDKALLHKTSDFFSSEFLENTRLFCQKIGLDFGEMDILLNRNDGRYYIIDINKTPYGPPKNLNEADTHQAISLLGETLKMMKKSHSSIKS